VERRKELWLPQQDIKLTGSSALMATKITFTALSGFVAMSLFVTLLQGLHIYCVLFTFSARTGNLDFH